VRGKGPKSAAKNVAFVDGARGVHDAGAVFSQRRPVIRPPRTRALAITPGSPFDAFLGHQLWATPNYGQ